MWTKTRLLNILLISACLFLFLPSVGICSESRMFQISETELETLSNHLITLEQNNKMLRELLTESDEQSTIALDALMQSREELEKLKAQLLQVQKDAESAKESLRTANEELAKAAESFKAYEKERDKTENRLRNQRNIWEVLCFVAVGVAVAR